MNPALVTYERTVELLRAYRAVLASEGENTLDSVAFENMIEAAPELAETVLALYRRIAELEKGGPQG